MSEKSTDDNINSICITPTYITGSVIFTLIVALLWFSILYVCYLLYISKSDNKTKTPSKKESWIPRLIQMLFVIVIIISLATIGYYPFLKWEYCAKYNANSEITFVIYFFAPWIWLYQIQNIALSLIFFLKIIYVFKGTSFELSKSVKCTYSIIYIVLSLSGIALLIWAFEDNQNDFKYLFIGALLLYMTIMLSMTILFIQRLVKIYRMDAGNNNQNEKQLVTPITRLTILVSISMIITLLFCIILLIESFTRTIMMEYIASCAAVADLYTNWVTAMLTDKRLENKLYFRVCGYPHNGCNNCWIKVLGIQNQKSLSDYQQNDSEEQGTSVQPSTQSQNEDKSVQV